MMLDTLINGMDRGMLNLSETFGGPVGSYCRLETVDRGALVADDGSLITVLRLEGSLKHVGVDEFATIVSGLTEKLQSSLSKPGHLVQVVFEYDPERGKERVRELLEPSKRTAQNLGLSIGPLLDNWGEALGRYCSAESCWLVLWTRPSVMAESLRKTALKERNISAAKVPNLPGCQNVGRAVAALHDAHGGFVTGVLDAFKQVDLLAYTLTPHEALREIRLTIDPDFTNRQWLPRIPGDPLPLRMPDPDTSASEMLHNIIYPDFKTQLWPREGKLVSRSAIRVGDRIFGPLIMTLMPQTPRPFQDFFRVLAWRDEKLPYRMSFMLEPGGLNMGIKPTLASILAFTNSDNKRFASAVEKLRALDLAGTCCVRYKICLTTWAKIQTGRPEPEAHLLLKRRMAELSKAVQGWGTSDVSEAVGDPLLGLTATLPAMMPASPAPATAAPLHEAIGMLPFRSASPWKEGSLLLRTQDGKIMPFAPNSSEQAAWIDIGVAPMGGGKSVFLNALNFAFITQAGLSRLPWVSIVDVGPSSSGLITLLKESLPEGKKHLAAYHRLRMTPDFAINPFDLPLGNRKPLPSHKAFLVNLLSLFCTSLEKGAAPGDGIPGLLGRAIDLAYEELSDLTNGSKPRLYRPNALPELHTLLLNEGIPLDRNTTWWEVVDALFDRGFKHEALQAQRFAVPLLEDISNQINQNKGIENTYPIATRQAAWRAIIDAIEAYVILKEPTRFDLGDAQVVSLDLDEVAPRGGPTADRQAATMYMLARHVLGSRFFLMPDDVKLMPKRYQDYHAERIEAIREDPKRLCYDEAHRVTQNTSVAGQLMADMTTMARESRKWNLSIGLYTQSIDDLPDIIIELATTILILGAGTDKAIAEMAKRFALNGACSYALGRLGKPGPAGSNLVAIYRTGAGKSLLVLSLTMGGQPLWAFSTTTEDVSIRNNLYKRLGPPETLRRLAFRYPGGSAKSEVERRRRLVADESGADDEVTNVILEIVNEIEKAVQP
jgi:intracellular multiplication protein IcmB